MSMKLVKESGPGKVLYDWWAGLNENRGARARLRRAATVTEIVLTPDYQYLFKSMQQAGWQAKWAEQNDRLAAGVGLLVHIADDSSLSVADEMSRHGKDECPPVRELRFLRILDAPDLDSRFTGLRRVLPLVKGKMNVLALVNDVIGWNDEVKKRWAYGYNWPGKE